MNKEMKELLNSREEAKKQAMEEIENILAIAEDRIVKATEESIKDVIEVATEIAEGIMDETRGEIEEVLERLIYKGKGKKKSKKFKGICNCIGNPSPFVGNPYMDDNTPQNKQITIEVIGGEITEEKLAILMAMLRNSPYDTRPRKIPRIIQI